MSPAERVIARLADLDFRMHVDEPELFGEPLPPLKAIAVDDRAHQLVLIAEAAGPPSSWDSMEEYDEMWRDLLFAISGLRQELRGAAPPALAAPILLAVVDPKGAERLREIAEGIAEDYALFSRLDIGIVDAGLTDPEELDLALAPLLPFVRRAIKAKDTVAPQDVERFWRELSAEIESAAGKLEKDFGDSGEAAEWLFGELRKSAGRGTAKQDRGSGPPQRIGRLTLQNFRSFAGEKVDLPPVALLHGVNGSGKTSICEALEILWSGRTQRIPDGDEVKKEEYERHLNHEGKSFLLRGTVAGQDDLVASQIEEASSIAIGRSVLAQNRLTVMADGSPKERFGAFLATSGMDLPELSERIHELRESARRQADSAFAEAGIGPLRAVNASGLGHLRRALEGRFAVRLPSPGRLEGAAEELGRVSGGAYESSQPLAGRVLPVLLSVVDAALAGLSKDLGEAPDPAPAIAEALEALGAEATRLREQATASRRLQAHLEARLRVRDEKEVGESSPSPMPHSVAAQWHAHAQALGRDIPELERLREEIEDPAWRKRLDLYIEALSKALDSSSVDSLDRLLSTRARPIPSVAPADLPSPELLAAARFRQAPEPSVESVAALEELHRQMTEYAARLDQISADLAQHPGREFASRAQRLMAALRRFELARELAQPQGSLARARESLVKQLLDERLFPLVRELVAALVRFEWYFKPLRIEAERGELRFWGLSSDDDRLDIRFLLNAAERTVVGVAWFLALHILQPEEDRKVLVLDDPTSGFDELNKAAFVATLRAVARLLKPEQLLITTHDDAMVALLEQELAEVEGWPTGIGILRCRRSKADTSVVRGDRVPAGGQADLQSELGILGHGAEWSPAPA